MKIYEIQLVSPTGEILYRSIVPEVHVPEKISTLLKMNTMDKIGAIKFEVVGNISERYINKFIQQES